MASIIKRKKNYSVVYNYVDENGETKQKWETWHTHKEALKRKAEIENQQHTGTFLPPSNQTITEFLYDFVSLYGEKKWGVSMYDSQTALIANYINPIIGDMEVQAVTPRAVDGYIQTLQKTKSVSTKTRKAVTTYVSDKTIEKIIKLLRCAFKQAVRWEIIARNPFDNVILPKTEYAKRDIWTADMIRLALDKCTDSKLYVAMNLSFACSLRMGEILGLTWENVHISDEDIAADNAYVYIDKELTRASKPRQSDPKNRISKTQNFLSKFLKSVRVQLANIHHAAHKNLPVTEAKLPGEGGTKKRCKPRKKACSGAFWRPREDLNLRPHA